MNRRHLLCAAAAMLALAASPAVAQSGRVVVYNAGGPELFKPMSEAFAAKYPQVRIDVINAGVGELFTRIRAETANPRGDVLMGASGEAFVGNTDLFLSYRSKEAAAFDPKVVGPNDSFWGFSMPLQALIVNTRRRRAGRTWASPATRARSSCRTLRSRARPTARSPRSCSSTAGT